MEKEKYELKYGIETVLGKARSLHGLEFKLHGMEITKAQAEVYGEVSYVRHNKGVKRYEGRLVKSSVAYRKMCLEDDKASYGIGYVRNRKVIIHRYDLDEK